MIKKTNKKDIPKNKGGRPLAFKSVEELQKKIDNYFLECKEHAAPFIDKMGKAVVISNPLIPTIAGLAYAIGVDRQTIYNYANKDEYFDTIKKARDYIVSCIESKLVNTNANAGGVIFLAKNYGYHDKQELGISGTITEKVRNMTEEQRLKRIAELKSKLK